MQRDVASLVQDRLSPYIQCTENLVRAIADRFQITLPPTLELKAEEPDTKRRRILDEIAEDERKHPRIQERVLSALRDPQRTLGMSNLTADEHRLLCTVVTESALLPDLCAMFDVYHPNVCLYCTETDRNWEQRGGTVHLGFYASTVLHEMVLHKQSIRRFTVVHLMRAERCLSKHGPERSAWGLGLRILTCMRHTWTTHCIDASSPIRV
jgi:hypothetical protein